MFKVKILTASLLTLALLCPAVLPSGLPASALEPQPQQSSAATAVNQGSAQAVREAELENKEIEGEADPNKAFRRSTPVKMIARMTGLSIDQAFWLCMVLNFVVIFVVLWLLLRKVAPAAYRNRAQAIGRRLQEARKAGEDARRRLAEVEARLSRLDAEIEQMRQEAEASAQGEEQRILAAAEDERHRIVESAEQEIARAANAARRELKAFAVELGISLAGQKIRIDEQADQKLVRDFATRLGRDGS